LEEENQALRAEITRLMQENAKLRDKISEMESTMLERISELVTEGVRQAIALLEEELKKAHAEISRLKAQINKDSSNSSKPPSTNGLKNVPNSREKSGNRQGGQKGHPGYRLQLPGNMEELKKQGIIETRVEDHTNGSSEYVSRFTIDVEVKVIITEHRFAVGEEPPEGLYNEVSYGNGIKALTIVNERRDRGSQAP